MQICYRVDALFREAEKLVALAERRAFQGLPSGHCRSRNGRAVRQRTPVGTSDSQRRV